MGPEGTRVAWGFGGLSRVAGALRLQASNAGGLPCPQGGGRLVSRGAAPSPCRAGASALDPRAPLLNPPPPLTPASLPKPGDLLEDVRLAGDGHQQRDRRGQGALGGGKGGGRLRSDCRLHGRSLAAARAQALAARTRQRHDLTRALKHARTRPHSRARARARPLAPRTAPPAWASWTSTALSLSTSTTSSRWGGGRGWVGKGGGDPQRHGGPLGWPLGAVLLALQRPRGPPGGEPAGFSAAAQACTSCRPAKPS
jgi:hypothetical protein